ncbi:hypothetical protein ACFLUV_02875 [Elusimicrobiota bacterium]
MLSVLFGLVIIVVGVLWIAVWGAWDEFLLVIQGFIPPFMILVGLVAVAAGVSSVKDNIAAKKEEEGLDESSASSSEPEAPEQGTGGSMGSDSIE